MNDIRRFNLEGDNGKIDEASIGAEQVSGIWSNDDEFISWEARNIEDDVEFWLDGLHRRAKKFVDSVRIDDLRSFCGDGDGDGDDVTDAEVMDAR